MYRWHFNRLRPADKVRDPVQGEFFAADAIGNPAEALVREGIQNSLDARDPSREGPVVVRICLSSAGQSLPADDLQPFLEGLRPHLEAPGNGLRTIPEYGEPCHYLLFEDFGTTGLTGDEREWQVRDGARSNHFYHFFRAEGRSPKGEQKRGRWGVGKQVFLRASRINTVFGLTVRADDRRKLLMGMTVLKSHDLGGELFGPDGWFGFREYQNESQLVLPIEDEQFVSRFSSTFNLIRKREAGLSIVVPWCDLDSQAGVANVTAAVLRGYFWPILRGQLEVRVQVGEHETLLDATSLMAELQRMAESSCEIDPALMATIGLAQWAMSVEEDHFFQLGIPPDGSWKWSDQVFPPGVIEEARARFLGGEKLALRVPVEIKKTGCSPQPSHFDVFLQRESRDGSFQPVYLRNGIIIPDVKRSRIPRGVLSIVVADDGPVAAFLGDAENPSHTQWQKDSSNFRGKYDRGPTLLNYVIQSVGEITKVLLMEDRQEDRELLKDFFSIPAPEPSPERQTTKKNGTGPEVPMPPEHIPPSIEIRHVKNGFSVCNGIGDRFQLPATIRIRAAYAVRSGNPFKKYRREDFAFDDARNIRFDCYGAEILWRLGNAAQAKVHIRDFRISVSGFDTNRDLRVSAEIVEGSA